MTADRDLLQTARTTLNRNEFAVWFTHHYQRLGRQAGSQALGITENAYRTTLTNAHRKLDAATQHQETP